MLRAVQAHPVVVNDLGDDGELASGRTVVDEDDATDLDESLEGGGSLSLLVRRKKRSEKTDRSQSML